MSCVGALAVICMGALAVSDLCPGTGEQVEQYRIQYADGSDLLESVLLLVCIQLDYYGNVTEKFGGPQ